MSALPAAFREWDTPELAADLSFTTFVKVVELQLLDMNTPDAEPCDFAVRRADGAFT